MDSRFKRKDKRKNNQNEMSSTRKSIAEAVARGPQKNTIGNDNMLDVFNPTRERKKCDNSYIPSHDYNSNDILFMIPEGEKFPYSNLTNVPKTPKKMNISDRQKTPHIPNTPDVTRTPIGLKTPNIPRTPQIPSSPYMIYTPNILRTPNSPYEMKTPELTLPKISKSPSIRRNLKTGEKRADLWIYHGIESEKHTKITGLNHFGDIEMVPTATYKLPPSSRILSQEKSNSSDEYIIIGDMFLDQKNSKGRDYHYVANNMRVISAQTNDLRKRYATKFRPLIKTKGKVTLDKFTQALEIYENNQVYFQDCIDDKTLTQEEIYDGLTKLEYWFICIIEPRNYDEEDEDGWKYREQNKLSKGFSGYCDPELYKYITQPLSSEVRDMIKKYHKHLFK